MTNGAMMAAVAAAAGLDASTPITVDAAFISANFPAVAAAIKAEGADAERTRIAAIEAAALPGHEALVAAHKADTSKTAGDLALAIIAAEKETRGKMLSSLAEDETRVKGLKTEPANGATVETPANPLANLKGEALWKAEYSTSESLQAEFASEGAYLAFKTAEASGVARILKK